jgi:hypothetical protein
MIEESTKRTQFYALVGHCILRFQHVEDYLEDIFAVILGGKRERADAVFASVRGVERKIQIIKAAATGLEGEPWDQLNVLLSRVQAASEVRGQIAHANPVHTTRLFGIFGRGKGPPVETGSVERTPESKWELHKQAKVFTTEDLVREHNRMVELFGDMVALVKSVKNPSA